MVEDVARFADRAVLEPERRGREADDAQVRIHHARIAHERLVHALAIRRNEVRLVDEHDVEAPQVAGLLVDRLDASDNDWVIEIAALQPGRVHAHQQWRQKTPSLAGILIDQLFHMGEHQNATVPALDDIGAQPPDDDALAATRWNDDAGVIFTGRQMLVDGGNRRLLVRPQGDHQVTWERR